MDHIKLLTDHQLSEREIIIFLLVKSGLGYRDIGKRLLIDHTQIARIYHKAEGKISRFSEAGFYSTPVK
jgi:DNA-binding CsgD family transcriptional regulator